MKTGLNTLFYSSGFTLLEALFSVFVVGVAALGLASLQGTLMKANTHSEQKYEANVLAEDKLETLRDFSTLTEYDGIITGNDVINGKTAVFTRSWIIATSSLPSYKTIQITVSWTSSENTSESAVLSSFIAGTDPKLSGKSIELYSPISP